MKSGRKFKAFVEAYKKKYNGKTPDAMAILGYDAMNLVANAIDRAGRQSPKRSAMPWPPPKISPAPAVPITIDANRNAEKPIVVLKIVDEKFTFVASIKP